MTGNNGYFNLTMRLSEFEQFSSTSPPFSLVVSPEGAMDTCVDEHTGLAQKLQLAGMPGGDIASPLTQLVKSWMAFSIDNEAPLTLEQTVASVEYAMGFSTTNGFVTAAVEYDPYAVIARATSNGGLYDGLAAARLRNMVQLATLANQITSVLVGLRWLSAPVSGNGLGSGFIGLVTSEEEAG